MYRSQRTVTSVSFLRTTQTTGGTVKITRLGLTRQSQICPDPCSWECLAPYQESHRHGSWIYNKGINLALLKLNAAECVLDARQVLPYHLPPSKPNVDFGALTPVALGPNLTSKQQDTPIVQVLLLAHRPEPDQASRRYRLLAR